MANDEELVDGNPFLEGLAGLPRGRPKVDEDQRHRPVGISMSPATAEQLRETARARGLSQGNLIKMLLEEHPSPYILALRQMWESLSQSSENSVDLSPPIGQPHQTTPAFGSALPEGTRSQHDLALELTRIAYRPAASGNPQEEAAEIVRFYQQVLYGVIRSLVIPPST